MPRLIGFSLSLDASSVGQKRNVIHLTCGNLKKLPLVTKEHVRFPLEKLKKCSGLKGTECAYSRSLSNRRITELIKSLLPLKRSKQKVTGCHKKRTEHIEIAFV